MMKSTNYESHSYAVCLVEALAKPMPKPTSEQRSNTKGSSPERRQFPVFFQFFRAVFNSNQIFMFIQLYPVHIKQYPVNNEISLNTKNTHYL
jgi:hypothetical protein